MFASIIFTLLAIVIVSVIFYLTMYQGFADKKDYLKNCLECFFAASLIVGVISVIGYFVEKYNENINASYCNKHASEGFVIMYKNCMLPLGNNKYVEYDKILTFKND